MNNSNTKADGRGLSGDPLEKWTRAEREAGTELADEVWNSTPYMRLNQTAIELACQRNLLLDALKRSELWVSTIASVYPGHRRDDGSVEADLAAIHAALAKAGAL